MLKSEIKNQIEMHKFSVEEEKEPQLSLQFWPVWPFSHGKLMNFFLELWILANSQTPEFLIVPKHSKSSWTLSKVWGMICQPVWVKLFSSKPFGSAAWSIVLDTAVSFLLTMINKLCLHYHPHEEITFSAHYKSQGLSDTISPWK